MNMQVNIFKLMLFRLVLPTCCLSYKIHILYACLISKDETWRRKKRTNKYIAVKTEGFHINRSTLIFFSENNYQGGYVTSFNHSVVMEWKCADRLKCAITDFPHLENSAFEIHHHELCTLFSKEGCRLDKYVKDANVSDWYFRQLSAVWEAEK